LSFSLKKKKIDTHTNTLHGYVFHQRLPVQRLDKKKGVEDDQRQRNFCLDYRLATQPKLNYERRCKNIATDLENEAEWEIHTEGSMNEATNQKAEKYISLSLPPMNALSVQVIKK
jgi:hypothetical protein